MHSQCIAPHSSDDRVLGTVLQHTAALKPESFLRALFARTLFSHRNSSTALSLVCMVVEVGSDFNNIF